MVDLKNLILDVSNSTQRSIRSKGIIYSEKIELDKIKFDKDQLKHVLINLVLNSADAVKNSGSIEVSAWSENGYSMISVKDNGSGIDNKIKEKLFEPFQTTKKDGVGLGLAISKKYCIENNSDLIFEENKPRGVIAKIIKEV